MSKRLAVLAALILTAGLTFAVVGTSTSAAGGHVKNFKHIFVIMMENTGIEALQGNTNAPWINQAMQTYAVAGNYFGVTHPSQPNYIASTAGTTAGVANDNDTTVNVPNIVDQLEAKNHTWKAYMQSLSLCTTKLDHACGNQLYERKHDPFVSFADVQSNPARMANIVDFSQLATDLAAKDPNKSVPDFAYIAPDQCHDMHGRAATPSDPCDFSNEQLLISAGDTFLNNTVNMITSSKAWDGESVIIITWDESDFTGSGPFGFGDTRGCCDANPGGGHVLTLVIQRNQSQDPTASYQLYNHYSLLSTVENSWNLGCLAFTCDTTNVQPMSDLTG